MTATIACYADKAVRFSLVSLSQSEGDIATEMRDWFDTFRGDFGCERQGLTVHVPPDLATCYSFNHLTGTKVDGEVIDVWFRETIISRQIKGRWRIVHNHEFVPFYIDRSLKAAVDLKPE